MLQNVKVDVVYYMCPSDFELEFNLCGCCRMRLLTDKAADRKTLISDMSRAIGRSRIAIICGPLFEKSGLIYTTAKAIGRNLVHIENKDYNINSDTNIEIIENAFPLVTKDGTFGGMIIESGSQAIILLTESRGVRKEIMQTLIHPYIEQVSITPSGSEVSLTQAEETTVGKHSAEAPVTDSVPQEAAPIENAEDTSENTENEPAETQTENKPQEKAEQSTVPKQINSDIDIYEQLYVLKTDEVSEPADNVYGNADDDGFFIEAKRVSHKASDDYAKNYVPSDDDKLFISNLEETYDDIEREQRLRRWTWALVALLGVAAFALIYYFAVIPLFYNIPYGEYLKILFGGR